MEQFQMNLHYVWYAVHLFVSEENAVNVKECENVLRWDSDL